MASHRSPNCPQISFNEAALKGRRVYEKEHTHPAPKAAVAEDLGYSGVNGRALSIIAALRQYGILEGPSDALRVTDDAVAFFELGDGEQRNEALRRMIFAPSFFESLRVQFGETLPSENNLKHHLIKEGFLPKAADEVIGVYRENLELVKNMPKRYTDTVPATEEPQMLALTTPAPASSNIPSGVVVTSIPKFFGAPAHVQHPMAYSFPLSMDVTADLQIRGGDVTVEDLEMLRDQIDMTIRALKRKQAPKPTPELSLQDESREGTIRRASPEDAPAEA
jgi:hypothetical protein